MLALPPARAARYARSAAARRSWVAIGIGGLLANAVILSSVSAWELPLPQASSIPEHPTLARTTHVYDVRGRLLATLHGEENRVVIERDKMPRHLRQAVVAIEDHGFFRHGGISVEAMVRALAANLLAGEVEQGGSTITQQYVRNAFDEIGRERTIGRKIEEVRAALELEERLTKDDILDRYLNTVYFGRGAYGVEAAARTYFGKPAARLRLVESAFLAGVIHAPGRYRTTAKRSVVRRNLVLSRMARLGFIEPVVAAKARRQPLRFAPSAGDTAKAAYFVEHVRRLLLRPVEQGGFGLNDVQLLTGGLNVYTTLDWRMQRAAERAVRRVLSRKDDPEAGLVAMTTDGEIRAMVGGRTFTSLSRARGFNFATQRVKGGGRQAGSAFKPFTLAAYLEEGKSPYSVYRASSRVEVPECPNGNKGPWRPANYQNQGYGALSVIEATEKSVNTVYAQMIADVGPAKAMRMARRAGIQSPLEPVCSLALGTFGVTPLEMARAYATFAARGARPEILAVTKVVAPDGTVLGRRTPRSRPAIDREVADKVNAILERVIERGTGTPARISRPAAGKTGTTEEHRDVWFAGYTPHPGLSAAVWMGYPPRKDGSVPVMDSLYGQTVTGGGFPGRMWQGFMEEALRGTSERSFPDVSLSDGDRRSTWRSWSNDDHDDEQEQKPAPAREPEPSEPAPPGRKKKEPDATAEAEASPSPEPTVSPSASPSPT